MNHQMAKEVGKSRYIIRRLLWRIVPPASMKLPTGVNYPTPKEKAFAGDVFVTECNVDWNAEFILASYLASESEKGDFLDVGAHIGYYSCLLSPYVKNIYSFEPDKRNHGYLGKALEGIDQAQIVEKAVSDTIGEVSFSDDLESSVSHIDPESKSGTVVPVTTLDDFVVSNGASPSAIKMDIEGFEILALEGSKNVAREHQPVYLVEYNREEGRPNSWEGLQEFSDSVGYHMFAVSRKENNSNGFDYTFAEHKAAEFENLSTKMIFLVPNSKIDWFENYANTNGTWGDSALRPKSIKQLLSTHSAV